MQPPPEDDEQRLTAASTLGLALSAQGKRAEAETLFRMVLAIQQRVLGREQSDTLSTAGNLAVELKAQGQNAEAETILR